MPRRISSKNVKYSLVVLPLLSLAACTSKPKESTERWGAFSTDTGNAKVVPFGGGASEKPYSEHASPKSR